MSDIIVTVPEAYAHFGDPVCYVSRLARGSVETFTIRVRRSGRTLFRIGAERCLPLQTLKFTLRGSKAGTFDYDTALVIARDCMTEEEAK